MGSNTTETCHYYPSANQRLLRTIPYLPFLLRKLLHIIFFGNIFYGVAAVLLAMETASKLPLPALDWRFYLLLGLGTIFFYTESYSFDPAPQQGNLRAQWIFLHKKWLMAGQWVMALFCLLLVGLLLIAYRNNLANLGWQSWLVAACFPLVAVLYYGLSFPGVFHVNIRKHGFLKPLIIGFVWTGAVVIYPILMALLQHNFQLSLGWPIIWYFTHNLMFITVLCVLFDIKDYAADHNAALKTYVVKHGLRSTIFRFVLPLVVAGMVTYWAFWLPQKMTGFRLVFNFLPFVLLLWVAYSMHRRQSILYYLLVIDGLMIVKAGLGIASIWLSGSVGNS